jgi:hypothetical protein
VNILGENCRICSSKLTEAVEAIGPEEDGGARVERLGDAQLALSGDATEDVEAHTAQHEQARGDKDDGDDRGDKDAPAGVGAVGGDAC